MPLKKQGKLFGYHGTDSNNVQSILTGGFTTEERKDHWLGQGIYFFTDLELAKWWIRAKKKQLNKVERGNAVIEVIIDYNTLNVLDLDTIEGLEFFFREARKILLEEDIGYYDFKEKEQYTNFCFTLDLLTRHQNIEIIICTFLKEDPRYSTESVHDFEKDFFYVPLGVQFKEKQVCVKSNKAITDKSCIYKTKNVKPLSKQWKKNNKRTE